MAEYVWIDAEGGVRSKTKVCVFHALFRQDQCSYRQPCTRPIRPGFLQLALLVASLSLFNLSQADKPLYPSMQRTTLNNTWQCEPTS
jgi:hypothetical protein